jgi:hypothetical protein
MSSPPQNWYPDPWDAANYRWWDGAQWTSHTAPRDAGQIFELARAAEPATQTFPVMENAWMFAAGHRSQTVAVPTLAELVAAMHLEPLRAELDEQIEVAGETYHVKGIKRVFREARLPITDRGSTLESLICALVPEPWNPHDPCAVAVMIGMHQVGYVPAELAANYSPVLCPMASSGTVITGLARIWAKDDGGMIRARVTILAPAPDRL